MERKYKIGDKVTIKPIEWYDKYKNENGEVEITIGNGICDSFVDEMSQNCGKELEIEEYDEYGGYKLNDGMGYTYYEGFFVGEDDNKIVKN